MLKNLGPWKMTVLAAGILIAVIAVIFTVIYLRPLTIHTANADDLRVILSAPTEDQNSSTITLTMTIENKRDYPIHLDGGFSLNATVFDSLNVSNEGMISNCWIEDHDGDDWGSNEKRQFLVKISFSPNDTGIIKQYQIQARFFFHDPGASHNGAIVVSSNTIEYSTTSSITSLKAPYY